MSKMTFAEAAEALCRKQIDFATFVRKTWSERRAMVKRLYRRLQPIPAWYTVDDADQEFLLALHQRAQSYDPAKATAVGYLRFGLKTVTKRVQDARGVERHRRSGPARFERSFTVLGIEDFAWQADACRRQEDEVGRRQYYEILRKLCSTREQRAVVCALERTDGSLHAATARMVNSNGRSFRSEREAARAVERVVETLSEQYRIPEAS